MSSEITALYVSVGLDLAPLTRGLAEVPALAREKVAKAFDDAARSAGASLSRLAADATARMADIARAVSPATTALRNLNAVTEAAGRSVEAAGNSVGALGAKAAAAAPGLDAAAAASAAAAKAASSLEGGASLAQKAVSGLSRVAANAAPRLDALSKTAFDPAGIVAGADEAKAALRELIATARAVPGAVRSGGAVAPVPVGGRRGGAAPEGEAALGMRAGAGAALDVAGGAAMLTTLGAALSGKLASSFDNLLQGVVGNTSMSARDASAMRAQVLDLMRTGTDEKQLAEGYMHVQNLGYRGKDASTILNETNRFGIATHTDVGQTADVVARILRANNNMPASDVNRVANTVHFAGADSNLTIDQLENFSKRTIALGAAYMGPRGLPDSLAVYSALVQHGLPPGMADTNVAGLEQQIAAPKPRAREMAAALGLKDFNATGLRDELLTGVMANVRKAVNSLPPVERAPALAQLFNNKQGGLGATMLSNPARGGAWDSAQFIANDPQKGTKAAFAGMNDAITPLFKQQADTATQALRALVGTIQSEFIPIGHKMGPVFEAAIPVVKAFAGVLRTVLDAFTRLPKPAQEFVLGLGALKIVSGFLPMLTGFALVSERTSAALGGLARMLTGVGPAGAGARAGLAGVAEAVGPRFLLGFTAAGAAVAGLALAWKKDWGGIREFAVAQLGAVQSWFSKNLPEIREAVRTVLGAITQFWHDHGQRIMAILGPLWDFVKKTVSAALKVVLDVVSVALDVLTGHWDKAGAHLKNIVANLWTVITALFVDGGKAVGNTLALLVSVVYDAGKRALAAAFHLGESIGTGIQNGLKSLAASVEKTIEGAAHAVIAAAKRVLGIKSPSAVFHEIGEQTVAGFVGGVRDSSGNASKVTAGVVDQAAVAALLTAKTHMTEAEKEAKRHHDALLREEQRFQKEMAVLRGKLADGRAGGKIGGFTPKGAEQLTAQYPDVAPAKVGQMADLDAQIAKFRDSQQAADKYRKAINDVYAAIRDARAGPKTKLEELKEQFPDASPAQLARLEAAKETLGGIKAAQEKATEAAKKAKAEQHDYNQKLLEERNALAAAQTPTDALTGANRKYSQAITAAKDAQEIFHTSLDKLTPTQRQEIALLAQVTVAADAAAAAKERNARTTADAADLQQKINEAGYTLGLTNAVGELTLAQQEQDIALKEYESTFAALPPVLQDAIGKSVALKDAQEAMRLTDNALASGDRELAISLRQVTQTLDDYAKGTANATEKAEALAIMNRGVLESAKAAGDALRAEMEQTFGGDMASNPYAAVAKQLNLGQGGATYNVPAGVGAPLSDVLRTMQDATGLSKFYQSQTLVAADGQPIGSALPSGNAYTAALTLQNAGATAGAQSPAAGGQSAGATVVGGAGGIGGAGAGGSATAQQTVNFTFNANGPINGVPDLQDAFRTGADMAARSLSSM